MKRLLEILLEHTRPVLLILGFCLVAGSYAYKTMPLEAEPDVIIPIIIVEMTHEGISPEDAERLLIRPMEKELRSIEGVKEMTANAREGVGTVVLEFEAGFDNKAALEDVRSAVDIAEAELPEDTDKPRVQEISFALFPALVVGLSGDVPERTLVQLARNLEDAIETIPAVLN
ncbi:MAG TPA: MFS transporter, partial [Opitutae bacterium]|nr:MFS transporter [Opitutae bacterium]